jgi:hypothetical protein
MRPMGQKEDSNLTKVSELITADWLWNVPLIHNLFFAPDSIENIEDSVQKGLWGGLASLVEGGFRYLYS